MRLSERRRGFAVFLRGVCGVAGYSTLWLEYEESCLGE